MKDTRNKKCSSIVGYWREAAIGLGLAAVITMAKSGIDITPIILLVGVGVAFRVLLDQKSPGQTTSKRFESQGGSGSSMKVSTISFDDIGGQEVAKRELMEALDFVRNAESAAKLGIRPLKGILLSGPPGTGKTLLAKAAAGYTGSAYIAASGSEFIEMYAGVGAQRVRQLFNNARKSAEKSGKRSAIVFIDELEVIGGKRGSHSSHLEYDQTLNQILVEMDGITTHESVRVLVIGATNRSDLLDSALLRPGRFDRQVKVDLPDVDGRLKILEIHMRNKPLADDIDMKSLAKETYGFSGAHLESLCNEAAILAMRQNLDVIRMKEFREAVDKVIMGERLDRRPTDEEMKRIAFHETGHALVSERTRPGSVSVITVTSRGQALGYMRSTPETDQFLYTKEQLEGQIAVFLAGALAEERFFGTRSSGAGNDFVQAANMAKRMVHLGMSELGVVSEGDVPGNLLHDTITGIIAGQEQRVRTIIEEDSGVFATVSSRLLEHEKMDGPDFRAIIKGGVPAGDIDGGMGLPA